MRAIILSIWSLFDPLYYKFTRLTYLQDNREQNNYFRVRLTCYKGRDVTLSDGTHIKKNDTLVKIHLHNVKLLNEIKQVKSELKRGKIIYDNVQRSLPGIQSYISNHHNYNDIKGIIGITSLTKCCERLGFEVVSISHPVYKWLKWTTFIPIMFLSTSKPSLGAILKPSPPGYLFMSKDKLARLYKR
ncbi:hypothetical protein [Bacillus sp. V5-8f]|uniref:YkoP family protein n=1 Tax=Bacillus sp. V5-8f TaxID=2053044 RepID=UPI000C78536B|nr:hypothetical protein [Bacillus sp. V5-8f]PLT35646.1 hypothetical protein CUU64_03325 [Bacillus sp. V5-8f]